jgi:mannose-6-phosphate isomerase-like protein (cupin superfamily)
MRVDMVGCMAYTLIHGDDPEIESFRGVFMKIRRALGATAFGINEIRLPPDAAGIEHDEAETRHEEVYLVLDGSGLMTVDGETISVTSGDYVRVDAAATRQVKAGPEGMRFLAVGAQEADAYHGRESL